MRVSPATQTTIRRSVALPSALIGELKSVATPELRTNLNRLVILSLQEYISRRRRHGQGPPSPGRVCCHRQRIRRLITVCSEAMGYL